MFNPDASTVLDALKAFMHMLTSNVEDAGLESLVENELTISQARVIMVLGHTPEPVPINELAARIQLSVASAGRNVEQLVRTGLVDRVEDENDRRIKRVSLSIKGRERINGFVAARRGRALDVLARLEPEDRVRLLAALAPILARLGSTSSTPEELAV